MSENETKSDESPGFTVTDKRFWARKETGELKPGERPPRSSDFPSVVEQLKRQTEAHKAKLKERLDQLDKEKQAFRKRLEEDMERRFQAEKHRLAGILLEVLDHLQAAVESAKAAPDGSALLEGVKVTRNDILSRLQKLDINRMITLGEPFDPHFHEAMLTRPVPADQDGIVLEEVQPGYAAGETVIRPAKVVVGKAEEE
jgi:molecular chaperone GrpE